MSPEGRRDLVHAIVAMALFALTLCMGSALAATPAELIVEGTVVQSEPVMATRRVSEQVGDCDPIRPTPGAGLLDVLRWDLRADCRTEWREEEYVDGWRVWYAWEDEVYSRVMDERPGETVRLKLTLH